MRAAERMESLDAEYRRALFTYLETPGEAALASAHALGRRALIGGIGVIDWAAIHEDALATLEASRLDADAIRRAGTFFRETLSPFEMIQRGYAENNRWLDRLNRDLRREIAEKERLEGELRDANQELEAFSYSVAHDLRAPLRHIDGFSQALLDGHAPLLDEEAAHLLRRIITAKQKMSDLIDGLLALARIARAELVSQPVDLAARAHAVAAGLARADPERRVVFDIEEPLVAAGDPRLLGAVLENLIGNAWKFTSKRALAHVQIGIDRSRDPPAFFVRDDGAGFDMNHASRLFGVFQRLHPQQAFPGTGVGLATVQRIVRRHGGRIWAVAAVDEGATFYFTLGPAAEPGTRAATLVPTP